MSDRVKINKTVITKAKNPKPTRPRRRRLNNNNNNTKNKRKTTNKNKNKAKRAVPATSQVVGLLKQLNNLNINAGQSINKAAFKRELIAYQDDQLAEYVYGLLHPDAVYRMNLNIKAPNCVPIPTSSFAFKETYSMKPNDSGNFLIVWNPNYLGTSDRIVQLVQNQTTVDTHNGYFSNMYINTDENLSGNEANDAFRAVVFKHIIQDFSKYRLTSACIKVKYTGKVLNQSGLISACASFMEFPRTIVTHSKASAMNSVYAVPAGYTQLSRLGDFDTIRQGQWARTVSIVEQPDGITCVYIPTDMLSQVFVDNADTIDSKDIKTFWDSSYPGSAWLPKNANITYDICGSGIQNDSAANCITVECYYNYEIIVREDQMPYFRPTLPTPALQVEMPKIAKAVQQIANAGTVTTTRVHDSPSTMSKIAGAIKSGYEFIEPYLPLLKIASVIV